MLRYLLYITKKLKWVILAIFSESFHAIFYSSTICVFPFCSRLRTEACLLSSPHVCFPNSKTSTLSIFSADSPIPHQSSVAWMIKVDGVDGRGWFHDWIKPRQNWATVLLGADIVSVERPAVLPSLTFFFVFYHFYSSLFCLILTISKVFCSYLENIKKHYY